MNDFVWIFSKFYIFRNMIPFVFTIVVSVLIIIIAIILARKEVKPKKIKK